MKTKLLSIFLLSVAFSFAQVVITDQSTPEAVEQNQNITLSFTYTSTVEVYDFQIKLLILDGNGDEMTMSDSQVYVGSGYLGNAPQPTNVLTGPNRLPIASTPTTVTFYSWINPSTVPVGTNYRWNVNLNGGTDPGFNVFGPYAPVTVVPEGSLGVKDFSINKDEMYISHELKSLVVNTSNVASESASVYNIMGKKIVSIDNLKEQASFDFSTLGNGVFVLLTNDNRTLKFVL
ncbi:hypothetical protein [Flavobacterium sp. HNIBRBA15423]|uniref:hypothetical protein n=1 Tax=Flavobacterium sp. HNIBRBA15423 TaxID=3458683 RepID=UPI0040448151